MRKWPGDCCGQMRMAGHRGGVSGLCPEPRGSQDGTEQGQGSAELEIPQITDGSTSIPRVRQLLLTVYSRLHLGRKTTYAANQKNGTLGLE